VAAIGMLVVPAGAGAKLTADYNFNGAFKNSHGPAGDLKKVGSGGDFKKVHVLGHRQEVWDWPAGTGLKLSQANKALGGAGAKYTFVLLVNLNHVDGYRKLIDFDNRQTDYGLYVDDKTLYPYDLDYSHNVIQKNHWYQLAMTRTLAGKVKGYVDGKKVVGTNDSSAIETLGIDKLLHFLLDDTHTNGEQTGGKIARLRIYDEALSGNKIDGLGH
jgi:hypothetical protein